MVPRRKSKCHFKQSGQNTLCTNHANFTTQYGWPNTPVKKQETCWRSSTKVRNNASLLLQMSSSQNVQISSCQGFDVSPWHSEASWTEHTKIEIVLMTDYSGSSCRNRVIKTWSKDSCAIAHVNNTQRKENHILYTFSRGIMNSLWLSKYFQAINEIIITNLINRNHIILICI